MNKPHREDAITLGILEVIDRRSDVSQRDIADRLNVALGLANLYLKRCVHKGLIKIKQAPANRYLYYVTPKGFAEKSRLTAAYLSISFEFYRTAGRECVVALEQCRQNGWDRLLFCGASELAEIAFLRAHEFNVTVVGILDPDTSEDCFLELPLWKEYVDAGEHDACLITSLKAPEEMIGLISKQIDAQRIFVPSLLRISSNGL